MGAISGKSGQVTFASGYRMGVYTWSIDYTADALEVTTFASNGYREYIPGLRGWSGSYECRLDDSVKVSHPGKPVATATFLAISGIQYSGNVIITGISLSVAVDGVATATFSFQGSGYLAIAGVTTTTAP